MARSTCERGRPGLSAWVRGAGLLQRAEARLKVKWGSLREDGRGTGSGAGVGPAGVYTEACKGPFLSHRNSQSITSMNSVGLLLPCQLPASDKESDSSEVTQNHLSKGAILVYYYFLLRSIISLRAF